MSDIKVSPSAKLLFPVYLLAVALAILIEVYRKNGDPSLIYLHGIPAFLLLWTLFRHIGLNFTTLTVAGGKLRYQSGVLSRSTRTMEIKKVKTSGWTRHWASGCSGWVIFRLKRRAIRAVSR